MADDEHACCGPARAAAGHRTAHHSTAQTTLLKALAAAASGDLRMVGLSGGTHLMGDEGPLAYPADGEGPVREVTVAPFAIGATTVTVAQFAAFVLATGHRTDAESYGDAMVFAGLLTQARRSATRRAAQETPWWRIVARASWFAPEGPDSTVLGREHHPVTQVSHRDALAYAAWVGARLPSEQEWEFAARGGLVGQPYPWGCVRDPDGRARMNIFSGRFPDRPEASVGTVAVGAFPPNGFGLHEMTGNVWEWTSSSFGPDDPRPVLRGGSYLCHESYCRRYRTSARIAATSDTSLGHTGFRVATTTPARPSADARRPRHPAG